MQSDGAGLLTARMGNAAVQPPESRELRIRDAVLHGIRRPAERGVRLLQVVLEQPRLGQRAANRELVLAIERASPKQWNEMRGRVGATATLERRIGAGKRGMQGGGRHGQEYTKYTSRWKL